MIYKFPVLFQFLLVIVYSFSPLRGMEEEQVQQQNPFQKEALFESIKCVPFEKWKANYPHQACANKVTNERLHSKSQTGTFSIEVFITNQNQGVLTKPEDIQVCSFIPKAVFFNDIPYKQRGFQGFNQQAFIKNIREQSPYQYALPPFKNLYEEFTTFQSIFFPESGLGKRFSFLRGSLFEQKISPEGLMLNALLKELEDFVEQEKLPKGIIKAVFDYLLNEKKPYSDTVKLLIPKEKDHLKIFLNKIQADLNLEHYQNEDLHKFLGRIKDDLKMDQKIFQKEQEIINQWKQDFFSLFKLAFANEGIGPQSSHQALKNWFEKRKEDLEEEIKERYSSRDFLEQAFHFLGYDKENKETLNNYSSHLETSIPFYVFKHQGFKETIKEEIGKINHNKKALLVNFTLYTHKNACEGCLGDSFLLWSFVRDTFFKDMPMTYTSVFNKEDKLVLQTKQKTDWQMGHEIRKDEYKLREAFSFTNPGDYIILRQNPLKILDFETLYLSAFVQGREWLPHIYKSKDVEGLMIPFLKDYLMENDYFIKNNPLWGAAP